MKKLEALERDEQQTLNQDYGEKYGPGQLDPETGVLLLLLRYNLQRLLKKKNKNNFLHLSKIR